MKTQRERREFLIDYLIKDGHYERYIEVPENNRIQNRLLRALMNVRQPAPIGEDFLRVQDEYLKKEIARKGITDIKKLTPIEKGIYLWKGDITTLRCGAIVNAANSEMTGCYNPYHRCIDNTIHTYAGVQLRLYCAEMMEKQGHEEPIGKAKLTPAFNLPSEFIIHTVGPEIYSRVTKRDRELLASCYRSSLELAQKNEIKSVAFCCISTGVFCFPNEEAAEIAVNTVRKYRGDTEVIFNVFKAEDYEIYKRFFN